MINAIIYLPWIIVSTCSQEYRDEFIFRPSLGEARESVRKVEENYNLPGLLWRLRMELGGQPRGLSRGQQQVVAKPKGLLYLCSDCRHHRGQDSGH